MSPCINGAAALDLSADEMRDIDTALADVPVEGERYPAELQAQVGR